MEQRTKTILIDGDPNAPLIEVITGSCHLCAGAVLESVNVAEELGYRVHQLHIDGPEAAKYGLKAVPAVVVEGEVAFRYAPTKEELSSFLNQREVKAFN